MVVLKVRRQNSPEMTFIEDNDIIQALSTNRTDQPFNVRILPRRSPSCNDFINSNVLHTLTEERTVDSISITNQEAGDFVAWKCLDNLLCRPLSRRMFGHVEMDHLPAVMLQDDEGKQYAESSCWNGEEVNCHDVL